MSEVIAPTEALVPQEAEYIGQLVVVNELDVNFVEREGLNYLTTPFEVYKTSSHDSDRFDLISQHDPLNGEQLHRFLGQIAPSLFSQSPLGIVSDWGIVKPSEYPGAEDDQKLVKMHTALGDSWDQFVESVPGYITVMEDANTPNFATLANASLRRGDTLRFPGELLRDLAEAGIASLDKLTDILEEGGVEDGTKKVYEAIAASKTIRRTHKPKHRVPVTNQTMPELKRRFESWSVERKDDVVRKALGLLDHEQRLALFPDIPEYYEVIELEDGTKLHTLKADLAEGETLDRAYQERSSHQIRSYAADFISFNRRNGERATVLLPGTARRVETGPTISPLISWVRDRDGTRQMIIERDFSDAPENFRDGVLGAMAIAYCEPKVRKDWPQRMSIGRKTQAIEEAQVPVLALLKRDDLMRTNFVEAAESVA